MGHGLNVVFLDTDPAFGSGSAGGPDIDTSMFGALGTVQFFPSTKPQDLVARAAEADVLVTNKVRLGPLELSQLPRLRMVSILATGTDVVDIAEAARRKIVVSNVPAYSTASAAQHAVALLLELTNRVGLHSRDVAEGGWNVAGPFSYFLEPLVELEGMTLGIAGWGAIGRRVGRIAEALGMHVVVHTRTEKADGATYVTKDELLTRSDVVSLHLPLLAATRGFIDHDALSRMKPGAFLINVARGGLVDASATASAIAAGRLRGVAVDVLEQEPPPLDHPWFGLNRVIITPHLAWTSTEARRRLLRVTYDNIVAFLQGAPIHQVGL